MEFRQGENPNNKRINGAIAGKGCDRFCSYVDFDAEELGSVFERLREATQLIRVGNNEVDTVTTSSPGR